MPGAVSSSRDAAATILYFRISTLRLRTGRDFIYSRPRGISGSHLIPGALELSSAVARREYLPGKTRPFPPPLSPSTSIRRLGRCARVRYPANTMCDLLQPSRLTLNCVRRALALDKRRAIFIVFETFIKYFSYLKCNHGYDFSCLSGCFLILCYLYSFYENFFRPL